MSAKSEILQWIKDGAELNNGIVLFRKFGTNPHFLRLCEMSPDSNRDMLNYQLCNIAKISEYDFKKLKGTAAIPAVNKVIITEPAPVVSKKFRDQFPFLNKKDCPYELKVLAADKITAWRNYTDAHKQLFTDAKPYETAKEIIDNYKENQAIYKELDYYNEHGSILGHHRIFKRFDRLHRLQKMNQRELIKKETQLLHNIWRIEAEIKKGDRLHLLPEREKRLEEKQAELAEIKKILGD